MIYFSFLIAVVLFYFKEDINECISEFNKFITFIHEHNPLMLSYCELDEIEQDEVEDEDEDDDDDEDKDEEKEKEQEQNEEKEELYENKYLQKFNNFTNDYLLEESDLMLKNKHYLFLSQQYDADVKKNEYYLKQTNDELNELLEKQEEHKQTILKKYDDVKSAIIINMDEDKIDEDDDDFQDDYDAYEELLCDIERTRTQLEKLMDELKKQKDKTEDEKNKEIEEKSYRNMIENKLNNFINYYIIEYTPIGNVIMNFNNYNKSFEYYSDHTIPYRYLETIGRKYVMTYRCKDIFIDMTQEVEKANKLNETKKNAIRIPSLKNVEMPPNRSLSNPINDVDIAVKDANRYTWKGKLMDFKMIKSDKQPSKFSFREFKKMMRVPEKST